MNKAPKIGERIQIIPGHRYYPCTGTVTKIWPKQLYDDEGFAYETEEGMPPVIGPAPEPDWQVTMEVDNYPKDWSYGATKKFCPSVYEIELVQS